VLLQWEDFKKVNAFRLLDRYREEICSFNDDIQGTSAVALAGITAATRVSGIPLAEQRVVMVGGGAAGVGISRLLRDALSRCGLDAEAQRRAVAVLDSQGLIVEGRPGLDRHKLDFAWPAELVAAHGLPADRPARLAEVVAAFRPTVLIGTSGQPGIFDEATVREMARHVERPVILPFSNPTSMSEARPAELLAWTDGRALVATGSPFDPVEYGGRTVHIGQGNNVFVFPGVGLGAVVAGARLVTDAMFAAAADTLARQVTDDDLARGSLFPPLGELRRISKEIAIAVGLAAAEAGLAEPVDEPTLRARIGAAMWEPRYPRIRLPGS